MSITWLPEFYKLGEREILAPGILNKALRWFGIRRTVTDSCLIPCPEEESSYQGMMWGSGYSFTIEDIKKPTS